MRKVHIEPDCGNAPRKLFLKDFTIAFATGDIDFISEVIPEAISWYIVGKKIINGQKKCILELKKRKLWKVDELTIDTIITHGREASVTGQILLANGKQISFCDIYKFKGAGGMMIDSITTFIVQL